MERRRSRGAPRARGRPARSRARRLRRRRPTACRRARPEALDPTVIVPPHPGTLSALGFLTADVRLDFAQASSTGVMSRAPGRAAQRSSTRSGNRRERPRGRPRLRTRRYSFAHSCDVRYLGQAYEVNGAGRPRRSRRRHRGILDDFHAHARTGVRLLEPGRALRDRHVAPRVDHRARQAPARGTRSRRAARAAAPRTVRLHAGLGFTRTPIYERVARSRRKLRRSGGRPPGGLDDPGSPIRVAAVDEHGTS